MPSPYRISIGVNIDASGARTGATEAKRAVSDIGVEAERSAPKVQKAVEAVERISTAGAGSKAKATIAEIGAAADAARPSIDRLVNSFAGITAPAANRNGRAADIAAYAQELDRLQAKFDPLFAAQQRYQQKLEEISQAERVGAISASAAIDARLRETNSYNALISAMDRVGAARKAAAEGAVGNMSIVPDRGADIAAYGQQLDQMRAKYNPVFATLTSYRAQLAEIREAHRVGAISSDEMTAAISRQRQAALATVGALKGRDGPDGQGQFRRQVLGYQLFDIGQGLGSGMPIQMIAAQQLPQIAQMYTGKGGLNTALKDFQTIAAGVGRLFTPLTIGVGGLTAAVALGATAWNGYLASSKEVETAAAGIGRATAGTAADMEAAAQAGAAAAGISVKAARSMEAQFLQTGKIGSENFEQLIGISKDFAATIGIDAATAGDALADMFADPAKAAQTLFQQYGLIDAATARQVRNLAEQNRASEAQAVLLKALPNQLADAEKATTALARAWNSVSTSASEAYDWLGKNIDRAVSGPATDAERLAEIENTLRTQTRIRGGRESLEQKRDEILSSQEIERYEEAKRAREAEENARSIRVRSVSDASGANSQSMRIEQLQNDIATLESGQNIKGRDATQISRDNAALEAKKRVLDALTNSQQRNAELDRLDIQIQTERNPLLRADLEARRTRLEMADQEVSADRITVEAGRARNRVIEETIAGAQSQAQDMQSEYEIRTRLNAQVASGAITAEDANRMLQEELTLRPLIAAAALAEGDAKDRLNKTIADLRAGYANLAASQKEQAGADIVRGQEEQLQTLRTEISLVGQSDAVRDRSMALLRAEQQIKREGLAVDSARAQQIRANAAEMSNLNTVLERQTDAWSRYKSAGESATDTVIDGIANLDKPKDILKNLVSDLSKSFLELGVKNPIKNALFGTNYGTLADLFTGKSGSSALSSMFGQSVGAMTVNAATVMINGGVGGGLGGLAGLIPGASNSNVAGGFSGLAGASSVGSNTVSSIGSAVDLATGLLGQTETANTGSLNSFLLQGGVDLDVARTKWCAAFVNSALAQVGIKGSGSQIATSFSNWGSAVDASSVMRGDVLVQSRGLAAGDLGGHVGLATGATQMAGNQLQLQMLSGNSGNSVATSWVNASELQVRRATEAASSLGSMANSASSATNSIGSLGSGLNSAGQGLGQFGQNLTNYFPAAPSAPSSGGGAFSWLGNLFGGGSSLSQYSGMVGLFDRGGYTGPGAVDQPAGVVHAGEIVWSQRDIARAGGVSTVESMRLGRRGYATGGVVSSIASTYAGVSQRTAAEAANGNMSGASNHLPSITVYVDNPRGDRDIEESTNRAIATAIRQYDKTFNARLQKAKQRPYVQGQNR